MKERTFRFINCERLDAWLSTGWMVVGHYRTFWGDRHAFILEWKCDCPLGEPSNFEKALDKGDKSLLSLSPTSMEYR